MVVVQSERLVGACRGARVRGDAEASVAGVGAAMGYRIAYTSERLASVNGDATGRLKTVTQESAIRIAGRKEQSIEPGRARLVFVHNQRAGRRGRELLAQRCITLSALWLAR
jgi:hypothetical protein